MNVKVERKKKGRTEWNEIKNMAYDSIRGKWLIAMFLSLNFASCLIKCILLQCMCQLFLHSSWLLFKSYQLYLKSFMKAFHFYVWKVGKKKILIVKRKKRRFSDVNCQTHSSWLCFDVLKRRWLLKVTEHHVVWLDLARITFWNEALATTARNRKRMWKEKTLEREDWKQFNFNLEFGQWGIEESFLRDVGVYCRKLFKNLNQKLLRTFKKKVQKLINFLFAAPISSSRSV